MFSSDASGQSASASASELIASLDAYERELDSLSAGSNPAELLGRLAPHFQQIQLHASSLAQLSVSWGTVLITRAEFTRAVWTRMPQHVLGLLRDQHKEAIQGMRTRCVRVTESA